MSYKKVETKLEGYEGPEFPPIVDDINQFYKKIRPVSSLLEKVGSEIEGYEGWIPATTEDDYRWFLGLTFRTEGGNVAVLFPWILDRSVAVYTKGKVNSEELEDILSNIRESFEEMKLQREKGRRKY